MALSAMGEASIRAANPTLDDVQGPRAWLHPPSDTTQLELQQWVDEVVTHQCNGGDKATPKQSSRYTRVSRRKLGPQALQLYTSTASPSFLSGS